MQNVHFVACTCVIFHCAIYFICCCAIRLLIHLVICTHFRNRENLVLIILRRENKEKENCYQIRARS